MLSFQAAGIAAVSASSTLLVCGLDLVRCPARPRCCSVATVDQPAEPVDPGRGRSVRAASRLASWSRRSANAAVDAGAERHRLLDLEVQVHGRAVDAAAVLDRHEREEAQQLLGAARGLVGRERRRGEALERAAARSRAAVNAAVSVAERGARRSA